MWVIRAVLVFILVAIILGFSVYNAEERVAVNLINTRYINVPLIFVAYWAFIIGMLVALVLFATIYFRQAGEIRKYRREAQALSHEISALRNRPIDEATNGFLTPHKDNS